MNYDSDGRSTRKGDWYEVDKKLKYRYDDVDTDYEHIHVILDYAEYSLYRNSHNTRHSNTFGLNDLSNSAQKRLKKDGVSSDYFKKFSTLYQTPNYSSIPLTQQKVNITLGTTLNNQTPSITSIPVINSTPTITSFPSIDLGINLETFPTEEVLVTAGVVLIVGIAIALAPETGGASLLILGA